MGPKLWLVGVGSMLKDTRNLPIPQPLETLSLDNFTSSAPYEREKKEAHPATQTAPHMLTLSSSATLFFFCTAVLLTLMM
jgi:hypothetical protein